MTLISYLLTASFHVHGSLRSLPFLWWLFVFERDDVLPFGFSLYQPSFLWPELEDSSAYTSDAFVILFRDAELLTNFSGGDARCVSNDFQDRGLFVAFLTFARCAFTFGGGAGVPLKTRS